MGLAEWKFPDTSIPEESPISAAVIIDKNTPPVNGVLTAAPSGLLTIIHTGFAGLHKVVRTRKMTRDARCLKIEI